MPKPLKQFLTQEDIARHKAVSEKALLEQMGMRISEELLGYGGTPDGRVWAVWRFKQGTLKGTLKTDKDGAKYWRPVLSWPTNKYGHRSFNYHGSGRKKMRSVAVLIATLFHGPRPKGMEVCHNNGVASDNRAENLRWDFKINNVADKYKHGTMPLGTKVWTAKLTDELVLDMRNSARIDRLTVAECARLHKLTHDAASDAITGKSWAHVPGALCDNEIARASNVGSHNPSAKLTEVLVFEMRTKTREFGWTISTAAETYGVTPSNALAVLTGKTWRLAGGPLLKPNNRRRRGTAGQYEWIERGDKQC